MPKNPLQALKDGAARGIKFFFEHFRAEPEKNSLALAMHKSHTPQEIYQSWLKNRPDTDDTYGDFATQVDWRVGQEVAAEYQSKFEDVYLVKQVQASWAAFAATGNPNNEFIPHREKYSAQNRQTMELNSKGCVLSKDLNTENLNSLRYVYEN